MIKFPYETQCNRIVAQKLLKKRGVDASGYQVILKSILKEDQGYLSTEKVKEILFLVIKTKSLVIPEEMYIKLAKIIPYNVVFITEYDGRENYSVVFKGSIERSKVLNYRWDAELKINYGTKNLEEIWKSIFQNFSSQLPQTADIINPENKELLEKIAVLEKNLKKEITPSRQIEINREINKLKKELTNGQTKH